MGYETYGIKTARRKQHEADLWRAEQDLRDALLRRHVEFVAIVRSMHTASRRTSRKGE